MLKMFSDGKTLLPIDSTTEYYLLKSGNENKYLCGYYLYLFKKDENGDVIENLLDINKKYRKLWIYNKKCRYESFDILTYYYSHQLEKFFIQTIINEEMKNWITNNKVDLQIMLSEIFSEYYMFVLNVG